MSSQQSMTEQELDQLQRAAFNYFLQTVNPANGLIADTSRENSPCSIGVVGFALSTYPVAVERGWMTRAEAIERALATLRFFRDSDQSGGPEASGFKGFYYHFLDMQTGVRAWRSELSNHYESLSPSLSGLKRNPRRDDLYSVGLCENCRRKAEAR
jgi:hypothetical protein